MYVCMYIWMCLNVSMCGFVYVCMHLSVCVGVRTSACMRVRMCVRVCTCSFIPHIEGRQGTDALDLYWNCPAGLNYNSTQRDIEWVTHLTGIHTNTRLPSQPIPTIYLPEWYKVWGYHWATFGAQVLGAVNGYIDVHVSLHMHTIISLFSSLYVSHLLSLYPKLYWTNVGVSKPTLGGGILEYIPTTCLRFPYIYAAETRIQQGKSFCKVPHPLYPLYQATPWRRQYA